MGKPKIAIISFPGTNGDTENLRMLWRCGMDAFVFKWNDSREKLADSDGYFTGAGFSYEDRGRSGMVAGRDPLMRFLADEADKGKVIVGSCNGAQILVESGLIPLDRGLRMSLARNAIREGSSWSSPGFLNEWVWIMRSCARDRCATSDWEGVMHIPIAHGEGRFTTQDKDVIAELRKNDQLAFSYCDAEGKISEDSVVTPNGSMLAAAGICNPAGNVVALMPHPERTTNGDPYFAAMRNWIEKHPRRPMSPMSPKSLRSGSASWGVPLREPKGAEVFIDTIITNNEERTVEQVGRTIAPGLRLKQLKYYMLPTKDPAELLRDIAAFNQNKERAYVRRGGKLSCWNTSAKREESMDAGDARLFFSEIALVRRDVPDTGGLAAGPHGESGICYVCQGITDNDLARHELLEIFANPHASTLERLV